MSEKRVPLYERLPEIHRIKDEEQLPPGQLKSFLALVEDVFGAIHENIEYLYHDLFIETCDDWVIPYLADLLGTSHLAGDPWTLRADVADTIALRRRKGTLGAIELLTFNLTQWGVHGIELRENLVWQQHLNHQRPDEGGNPTYGLPLNTPAAAIARSPPTRHRVIRGGTATVRDLAMLSLLHTPFDPFAHTPDLKPPGLGAVRYNLPNLAIFLWRLEAYRVDVSKPVARGVQPNPAAVGAEADFIARFEAHPLGEPLRLFNTYRFDVDRKPPVLTRIDETPGPIPLARLSQDTPAGRPEAYVTVETYDVTDPTLATLNISDHGLQLHLPETEFGAGVWLYKGLTFNGWTFRGANLCAWESGLESPLKFREIAIDPVIGRVALGLASAAEGAALVDHLLLSYTYGAVGPVGAHPISRAASPQKWLDEPVDLRRVRFDPNVNRLQQALDNIQNSNQPILIEIEDSMTYDLDLGSVAGTINEAGGDNLRLNRTLIIRAASDQRPIIRLAAPLRFRPTHVVGTNSAQQKEFDAVMANLSARLEGIYITRGVGFPAGEPLIARAALNSLEVIGCTLDPGGFRQLDGTRASIRDGLALRHPYGFADPNEEREFKQTPEIHLQRSITGPLLLDTDYRLFLTDSIVDAGRGVADDPGSAFAVSSASDPLNGWGPPAQVSGVTFFGRVRVESINGRGGIWVHALEVLNNQKGCLKFSYFSGLGDRLPQNHGCVKGMQARLRFTAETFGDPAYGQLALTADFRIRERGPNNDAMGAFGFLLEAHKWRNLQIRYREFMPVGVRPLLIPVT